MSYLHCPTCKCAYNIALCALCPNCPVPTSEVDPAEDIVAAAERLAHAMSRATTSERKAATSRMDQLALPAPGAKPVTFHGAMLRSIREAIEPGRSESGRLHFGPAPAPVPKPQPLLATIAFAVIERISASPGLAAARSNANALRSMIERAPRLVERIPTRLRSVVRRALAA